MIYKCAATTNSKKLYLGLTEGEFKKQRYYDHVKSSKNEFYANSTSYPLKLCMGNEKKKKNVTPALTWEILKTAKAYSSCLHEKLAIITYPYPDELLSRQCGLFTKCRHEKNFNSIDWSFEPYDNLRKYKINNILNGFILLAFSAWVIWQEQKKDIFKLIWRCLCFAFIELFRCWMLAIWIYLEYC